MGLDMWPKFDNGDYAGIRYLRAWAISARVKTPNEFKRRGANSLITMSW